MKDDDRRSEAVGEPGLAPGEQPSDLAHVAEPLFKTVSTGNGRHGIRLERAFWSALEKQSAAAGRKRGGFVGELIERAQREGLNAASVVRSLAIEWLQAENARLAPLNDPESLLALLQLSPAPSFALDRQKRLRGVNPEFVRYLRLLAGNISGSAPVDTARLSLDRPADQIFSEVAPGAFTECGVTIRMDNRERRSTAKIVVMPPSPPTLLVGYLLS